MKQRVLKLNEGLEIIAEVFPSGICISISEGGDQVSINIGEWKRMIDWWHVTYGEMLQEHIASAVDRIKKSVEGGDNEK